MARPIDLSTELNERDSIRFVNELIRVDSLPKDSPEMVQRRKFLNDCKRIASTIKWLN
ncbi:MAG: hypothetical protein V1875_00370 [Candidatus Altiarchaeota archaeon]